DERSHVLRGASVLQRRQIRAGFRHYLEAARLNPQDPEIVWLARRTRTLSHPGAVLLRLYWRVGRLRILLALLFLVVFFEATGLDTPLAAISLLCVGFFYYLVGWGLLLRIKDRRRPK